MTEHRTESFGKKHILTTFLFVYYTSTNEICFFSPLIIHSEYLVSFLTRLSSSVFGFSAASTFGFATRRTLPAAPGQYACAQQVGHESHGSRAHL